MEKNNKKRWLAVALALLVVVVSLFTKTPSQSIEEKSDDWSKEVLERFGQAETEVLFGTNTAQRIEVIDVDGVIASDITNDEIVEKLKKANDDPSIAGVIMHINSPGGSVYASEKIYKQIKKLQTSKKPVYAVMQELAASGGYYISAPCDKIFASNETWTGSIGVIMQSYSLEGLFEKYGIKEQNITTGKMKDAGSPGRDMDKEEKEYFQSLVDSAFDRFVKVVAEGRGLSEEKVKSLADGRVYDGSQALENGLIDKIGDLEDAAKAMAEDYKFSDPMVIKEADVFSSFSKYFPGFSLKKSSEKSDLEVLKDLMEDEGLKPMYIYGGSYE